MDWDDAKLYVLNYVSKKINGPKKSNEEKFL